MKPYEVSAAPSDVVEFKRPPKLNILIADVSGSMGWAIRDLVTDIAERVKTLPQDDAVLIGIFSSSGGDFKWIAARELSSSSDYDFVETQVKRDMRIWGMTCFSEILTDVPQAIKPFLAKFQVVTCTFFSDGHPNAYPYDREESNIFKALERIRSFVTSSSIVAYGDYANRQLLGRMAKAVGGELVTAQRVSDIGDAFSKLSAGKARKKRKVSTPSAAVLIFSFDNDGSVTTLPTGSSEVEVPETASVYAIDDLLNRTPDGPHRPHTEQLTYAAALALLSDGRVEEATEVLSAFGEVAIVKALDSAITNAELAKGEEMIRKAMMDTTLRFAGGRQYNCRPPEDAFDLIDLLQVLQEDDEAKFSPRHPDFVYKKIGRPTKTREGFPEFKQDDVMVALADLVGNSSELNLSVRVTIPGSVELPDSVTKEDGSVVTLESVGLDKTHRSVIFRNYSLISNALPNVTTLPVTMSADSFAKIQAAGAIDASETYEAGKIFKVDLTAVPACNKARGKSSTDWEALCRSAIQSVVIGAKVKVFKAKRDELDPERAAERPTSFTDEQFVFLEACGFRRDGSFSPPVDAEEATDALDVRVFEAKVKGCSTMPKVSEVIEKAKGGKKLNTPGEMMKIALDEIDKSLPSTKGAAIEWLNKEIKDLTAAKRLADSEASAQRYAVAIGGHWAKVFKEDEQTFEVDKQSVTLTFRTTEKKI